MFLKVIKQQKINNFKGDLNGFSGNSENFGNTLKFFMTFEKIQLLSMTDEKMSNKTFLTIFGKSAQFSLF